MPPSRPLHTLLATVAAAAMPIGLASCGGGSSLTAPSPPPPASIERELLPQVADPRVDMATEPHVAINPDPAVAPVHRLFVFLPGTGGVPGLYRQIVRSGARHGLHSLGLNYPNPQAVGILCLGRDDGCFWDVRRETITGTDTSPLVDISEPNAIVTRLVKAIEALARSHPNEGWGEYLAGGSIDWHKVVIAGHSQGGGHAGVMSKLWSMHRACYFASPPDWSSSSDAPATWMVKPNLTPASQQFGFTHVDDPLVPTSRLFPIWQTLGLGAAGVSQSVDGQAPPYAASHQLTTAAEPVKSGMSASPYHGVTVLDAVTPLGVNGQALFDAVWGYACFE